MRQHVNTVMDTLELSLLREQHNGVLRQWSYDGERIL